MVCLKKLSHSEKMCHCLFPSEKSVANKTSTRLLFRIDDEKIQTLKNTPDSLRVTNYFSWFEQRSIEPVLGADIVPNIVRRAQLVFQ